MPLELQRPRETNKHHYRRYSWPPSLHLIDISTIHIPLPDIDDDPFAHFVSSPPAEDDFDPYLKALACTAGIYTPHPASSTNKEKASKFRTSIARKWARFMGRRCAGLSGSAHLPSDTEVEKTNALGANAGAKRYYNSVSGMGTTPKRTSSLNFSQQKQINFSKQKTNKRPARNRWARHSWHAPAYDLYTIKEEIEPAPSF